MAHARQQIRERVAYEITGLTTTADRVFHSRMETYPDSDLPCWSVFILREQVVDEGATLGKRQRMQPTVVLEGRAKPTDATDVDDLLDTMAAETQKALGEDPQLAGYFHYFEIRETEIGFSDDQERPLGIIRLYYQGAYDILADDAETILHAVTGAAIPHGYGRKRGRFRQFG